MSKFWGLGVLLPIMTAAGCSTYPLPEDVTGYESKYLARITRCSARDGLRTKYKSLWREFGNHIIYQGKTGDQLGDWLDADTSRWSELRWDNFSSYSAPTFKALSQTTISYDFTIDSTENNASGLDATLLRGVTGGTNTLGIVAKNDRTRQVKRQFRNYDNFTTLLINLKPGYCDYVPKDVNPLYPAAGLVRIGTLIDDFIEQNQDTNLGSKDKAEDAEMNDTITFTTKFVGNISPGVTNPAALGIYVPSSLKVTADNYRLDVHTIIVLIRLPNDKSKLPKFDQYGLIADPNRAVIDTKLDQIRVRNTQDDIRSISTTIINRTVPF